MGRLNRLSPSTSVGLIGAKLAESTTMELVHVGKRTGFTVAADVSERMGSMSDQLKDLQAKLKEVEARWPCEHQKDNSTVLGCPSCNCVTLEMLVGGLKARLEAANEVCSCDTSEEKVLEVSEGRHKTCGRIWATTWRRMEQAQAEELLAQVTRLTLERDELKVKLEILRKENRGTMHGRHEMTLKKMHELCHDNPYSSRGTELVFFEWVEKLQADNLSIASERDELKREAEYDQRNAAMSQSESVELLKENERLKADNLSIAYQVGEMRRALGAMIGTHGEPCADLNRGLGDCQAVKSAKEALLTPPPRIAEAV